MENWANQPNEPTTETRMPIMRVLPGRPKSGIILSVGLTGAYTHFWRGRTTICTAPECDACDANRLPRWYGYLAVWSPSTKTQALFELTPAAAPDIIAHQEAYGTLRTARLTLQRANAKANSRVQAAIEPTTYATKDLPEPPNVRAILQRIWELKIEPVTQEMEQPAALTRARRDAPRPERNGTH